MADLAAEDPFTGIPLPLAAGEATLSALPATARASVAPFAGHAETTSETLRALTGAELPPPGRAGGPLAWFAIGQWLVEGHDPSDLAARLAGLAAVTDQTDAWAAMRLAGPAAPDVLARLVPLDLDPARFPAGSAARSLLRHVPLLLLARGGGLDLLVPRSYARTAVHELAGAMRAVAARRSLTPGREGL